ncbi:putative catalytic subunit of a class II histone deacetylase complex [Nadsonia fulvescens var. elongata DSM 6958]|uniref:Histone deacetylase HDA1 n=1 Tax=Nadsonia fulvescens var. elongata DSM 6958 TaxID=857566 RepID=A0A1E3PDP5_9ASCO|nr:putative catalytic subunit of a class II histone deacetylase complex [Nadsonia fulvescens var. elongata DSM 6958]
MLNYALLKTGICYDVRMRYHAKIVTSPSDYTDPHPEDPRRIFRIYKILAENGLINDPSLCGAENIGNLMQKVPVREATDEEILEIHSKEHLDYIVSTSHMSRQDLVSATTKSDSVYFNNESYQSARLSCGGAIEICKAVVENQVKNGLAVVRPPGHHAEPDVPGGFCLFSNVAVAAKNILKNYPEKIKKILILDWDVHHGNGTQKSFWNDPNVLYISLHRYEDGKFYPATNFGGPDKVGDGAGEGFNVNIPWTKPGMGDSDYLYAFNQIVMPIGLEFNPDFVIISSGFDAAEGDMLGGCLVSPDGYSQMTYMLKSLAAGNLAVVLEGGYNLDSIAKSALAVTKILLGDAPGRISNTLPKSETIKTVRDIIKIQSRYWKSLLPGYGSINMGENTLKNYDYLHDALRGNQVRKYMSNYSLVNLPIIREKGSPSYNDQILCSADIHKKGTVVVIVHDSPEVWGSIDPVLGTLDNSQSIVVDGSPRFIEWAQKNDYGVLDINIPRSITGHNSDNYSVANGSQDTCLYVWDNYIQCFDATKIIFVGINEAYSGIVHLVGHRETREKVSACISFIGDCQLRSIVTIIDEYITDWYYHSSLVFTSRYHPCWDKSLNPKRPRRKFGRVIMADQCGSNRILEERFQEAVEFIEEALESESEESDSG